MKTLIIAGSPRADMYSDRIADLIKEKTDGNIIHLRKMKIGYCHACDYCKDVREGECIQRDDMTPLYSELRTAGTIALVSPVYWWQVTAQMKTFIDRLYAFTKDDWKDKKFVVILNGGADNNDIEFDILKQAFDEMFSYLGVSYSFLSVGTEDENAWEMNKERVRAFIENNF